MIDWITSKLSFTTNKKKYSNDCVAPIDYTDKVLKTKNNSIRITIHEKDIESQEFQYYSRYSMYRSPDQYNTMKMF